MLTTVFLHFVVFVYLCSKPYKNTTAIRVMIWIGNEVISPLALFPSGPLPHSPPNQTGLALVEQIMHLSSDAAWHDKVNNLGNSWGEKEY